MPTQPVEGCLVVSQLGCESTGQNKTSQDRQQSLTKFASLKWFTFVWVQTAYFSAFAGEGQLTVVLARGRGLGGRLL